MINIENILVIQMIEKGGLWKFLVFIPIALLLFSVFVIFSNILERGFIIERDVELAGGKMITIDIGNQEPDLDAIKDAIPYASVHVASGLTNSLIVEISYEEDEEKVINELHKYVDGESSIRTIGPAMSEVFWEQTQIAIIVAFVFIALIIFILFRSPVPCSLVVFAAATDIIATVAIMSIVGIKLSLPVLAALLMLIGYSVDTDILLTSEVMKRREKELPARIRTAMKTGLTMTTTTLAALVAIYFVTGSFVLEQIAIVLMIGLSIDIPSTWFTNAGLLRLWVKE